MNQAVNRKEQYKKVLQGKLCPYCLIRTEYIDSKEIYGKSYGMIYCCPLCKAFVGTHKKSKKALGRVANEELRGWKKKVHNIFDQIWKNNFMSRSSAYFWLSEKMNRSPDYTHIGMFNIRQCKQVIDISRKYLREKEVKYEQ